MDETLDVMIIGAGQAGLALAKALIDEGRSVVLLEAEEEVGSQWRKHYDSLELFTPRKYSALPGLDLEGDSSGYAHKDEFADYLSEYAQRFSLPVVLGARVQRLRKEEVFIAETQKDTYRARAVVIAVGYSEPSVPQFAHGYRGLNLHSSQYRNSAQIPRGKVLVVGGGNSGAQIAVELSASHTIDIALTHMPETIPSMILGKSFYWWNTLFGLDRIPTDSFLGRILKRDKDYVVGTGLLECLRKGAITARPAVHAVHDRDVVFSDASSGTYDAVIWATGFLPDYHWIDISDALKDGKPIHMRGVSPVPGLFYAGLRNQISIFSGNIYGTHINTSYIVREVEKALLVQ